MITKTNDNGKLLKPNTWARDVNGNINVAATTANVAISKDLPGRLCRTLLRLRMTSTTSEAEMTDSINHPVRNWVSVACKTSRRAPKVR